MPRYQTTGELLQRVAMLIAIRNEGVRARDRAKAEVEFWERRIGDIDRKIQFAKREAGVVE